MQELLRLEDETGGSICVSVDGTKHTGGLNVFIHVGRESESFITAEQAKISAIIRSLQSALKCLKGIPVAKPRSSRWQEVLAGIAVGKSNKEIARELGLAEGSIRYYCKGIYKQLGVKTRLQAALLCRDNPSVLQGEAK